MLRPMVCGLSVLCACSGTVTGLTPEVGSTGVMGGGGGGAQKSCGASATGLRRLNRREFAASLKSLLGRFDDDLLARLPIDPRSGKFDTNAAALSVDTDLLERYLEASDVALERAVVAGSRFLSCTPKKLDGSDSCVRDVSTRFAQQAYRRRLTAEDETELRDAVAAAAAKATDAVSLYRQVFLSVLVSPKFFLVMNQGKPNAPDTLDAESLAVKLSLWLTAAPPDEQLLEKARSGALDTLEGVAAEVSRLLESPASVPATDAFAQSWLSLGDLEKKQFNTTVFPKAKPELFRSMVAEAKAAVRGTLLSTQKVSAALKRETGALDGLLAEHYGLPAGTYSTEVPTTLPPARQSLFGLGAVLASTSHPDRTSLPLRGMWVLENVLCIAPPPVPNDVDTSKFRPTPGKTQREQLAEHRANPSCANCHTLMDQLGGGLENFDGLGGFRTEDLGAPVDASGVLPPDRKFDGPESLSALLMRDYGAEFTACLAQKVLSSAANRLPSKEDACFSETMHDNPPPDMRTLLQRIATSAAFLKDTTLTEEKAP
jgi:Protein of unknown function (DUF1592)/Protein of unknown function (DUF1588)/Protein of unknown function (DUF1587)